MITAKNKRRKGGLGSTEQTQNDFGGVKVMSEDVVNPASPNPSVSSISLVEIKEDTRLVLKAFLRNSLSVPQANRPGTVGGTYKDPYKYRANAKKQQDNSLDSVEEKPGIKDLIKRKLQARPSTTSSRRSPGDQCFDQTRKSSSLGNDNRLKGGDSVKENIGSPSTSEDEGNEGREQKIGKKKNKLKSQFSSFFNIKKKGKDDETPTPRPAEKDNENARPQRPATLNITEGPSPDQPVGSPAHPPEFYQGVAGTLERIAQRSQSIKRPKKPSPERNSVRVKPPPKPDKEEVVRQLVQVLSMEGDIMNSKIKSDPFLRSTLNRLSYPSFAKLLDTFAIQEQATPSPLPSPTGSPTLRRVAVTMEVSRRVVTAAGTQHMQGYAERYMENFAPWVKSHGGWERIVQLEEILEYD